jgi:hypothetical protein
LLRYYTCHTTTSTRPSAQPNLGTCYCLKNLELTSKGGRAITHSLPRPISCSLADIIPSLRITPSHHWGDWPSADEHNRQNENPVLSCIPDSHMVVDPQELKRSIHPAVSTHSGIKATAWDPTIDEIGLKFYVADFVLLLLYCRYRFADILLLIKYCRYHISTIVYCGSFCSPNHPTHHLRIECNGLMYEYEWYCTIHTSHRRSDHSSSNHGIMLNSGSPPPHWLVNFTNCGNIILLVRTMMINWGTSKTGNL